MPQSCFTVSLRHSNLLAQCADEIQLHAMSLYLALCSYETYHLGPNLHTSLYTAHSAMAEIPLQNSSVEQSLFPNVCSRGNQITLNFPFWIIHYASKDLKPSAGTSDDERKACQPLEKQAFATDSAIPKDDSSLRKQKFLPYEHTCLRESLQQVFYCKILSLCIKAFHVLSSLQQLPISP